MYRYFIQPQFSRFTNSISGYEMLIRKSVNGQWRLPKNFAAIPIEIQTHLLHEAAVELALKVDSLSFNLNRTQFLNDHISAALVEVQQKIYPVVLTVEVTEEPDDHATTEQILEQIHFYNKKGIEISLDDVATGVNTLEHIQPLLPEVVEIKVALQNFRAEHREDEIETQLKTWTEVAAKYQLRLVLEGVENDEEDQMANRYDIDIRQGYYYGKPHLFNLEHHVPITPDDHE